MRADSQRNGELDIDQVKMFFLLHFDFYPNLIRKYRMNCCSVLILENRMHILWWGAFIIYVAKLIASNLNFSKNKCLIEDVNKF